MAIVPVSTTLRCCSSTRRASFRREISRLSRKQQRTRARFFDSSEIKHRKAELAVEKQNDELARAALARSLSHQQHATGFAQQLEDQTTEAETLRNAFTRLEQKLQETRTAAELLIARNRRARTVGKANHARGATATLKTASTLNRLRSSIEGREAANLANHLLQTESPTESLEDTFANIEREDQINRLLEDLKSRQPRLT
jgi:phage shock protein A